MAIEKQNPEDKLVSKGHSSTGGHVFQRPDGTYYGGNPVRGWKEFTAEAAMAQKEKNTKWKASKRGGWLDSVSDVYQGAFGGVEDFINKAKDDTLGWVSDRTGIDATGLETFITNPVLGPLLIAAKREGLITESDLNKINDSTQLFALTAGIAQSQGWLDAAGNITEAGTTTTGGSVPSGTNIASSLGTGQALSDVVSPELVSTVTGGALTSSTAQGIAAYTAVGGGGLLSTLASYLPEGISVADAAQAAMTGYAGYEALTGPAGTEGAQKATSPQAQATRNEVANMLGTAQNPGAIYDAYGNAITANQQYMASASNPYQVAAQNTQNFINSGQGTVNWGGYTAQTTQAAMASASMANAASVDFSAALQTMQGAIDNTKAWMELPDKYLKDFSAIFGSPGANMNEYFKTYKPEQLEANGLSQVKAQFDTAAQNVKKKLAMQGLSGSGIESGVLNEVSIAQAEALAAAQNTNRETYYDKLMAWNQFEATSKIQIMNQQLSALGMQNQLSMTYGQLQAQEQQINADYQQQVSLANASNATQVSLQNAQSQNAVNIANMNAVNQASLTNAQMGYAAAVDNRNFNFNALQYQNQLGMYGDEQAWNRLQQTNQLGINQQQQQFNNYAQLYGIDQGVAINQATLNQQQQQYNDQNQQEWIALAAYGVDKYSGIFS